MYTPSKKIIYILIASIISVSLLYIAHTVSTKNNLVTLSVVEQEATDTANANVSNADEIALNKILNPAQVDNNVSTTSNKTTTKPLTLTETFSQDFLVKSVEAQNSGLTDESSTDSLSNSILDQYSASIYKKDHFDVSSVVTSSSLDQDKIRQYANSFLTVEEDGQRAANALAKDNEESLVPMGESYKELALKLGNLVVPDILTNTHLAIMNNYFSLGEILIEIPKAKDDPLKKLLLMQKFSDNQTEREGLYGNIASFIKKSGIIFDDTEPGHYWLMMTQ